MVTDKIKQVYNVIGKELDGDRRSLSITFDLNELEVFDQSGIINYDFIKRDNLENCARRELFNSIVGEVHCLLGKCKWIVEIQICPL